MNISTFQSRLTRATSIALIGLAVSAFLFSILAFSSSASAQATAKSGNMLIYSDKGVYKKAVIFSTNGDKKCAGKKTTGDKGVTVSLSKAKDKQGRYLGVRVPCEPGNYNIYFLKKNDKLAEAKTAATQRYAAVSLPEGYCSFVHKKGVTRNEVIQNKRCVGDDNPDEDKVEKFTPIITASTNPATITQGTKYTMFVELKHPSGAPLSVEECSSSFVVDRPIAGASIKNNQGEYPIRYNAKTKTCQYKQNVSSSKSKTLSTGIYNLNFKGNVFMNPASTEYRETVVQNPAVQAKKEKAAKKKAGNTATAKAKITTATATKTQSNAVNFRATVTGVDDCSRIKASLDSKIKKKSKKANSQVIGGNSPQITIIKEGTTCVLTSNISYAVLAKSDVKYKLTFKAGNKQITKTTNKVTLGN